MPTLDAFTRAYLECALWSSNDNNDPETGGDPLGDTHTIEDITQDAIQAAIRDCSEFQDMLECTLDDLYTNHGCDPSQAGHDFWLTRNGHGAGFWDRGYPQPHEGALVATSKAYGKLCPIVGYDGLIYGLGE